MKICNYHAFQNYASLLWTKKRSTTKVFTMTQIENPIDSIHKTLNQQRIICKNRRPR